MRKPILVCILGVIAGGFPVALADQATLRPLKDNTLYQDPAGTLSNGLGETMFAGTTAQSLTRRAVLSFDLTGIPPGSSIQSVSLTMSMSRTRAGTRTVTLHRLLADWGEGDSYAGIPGGAGTPSQTDDATWIHRFYPDVLWSTAGGQFNVTSSASAAVGGIASYSWSSTQMATDVQNWVNNPATNFGWLVRGDESTGTTAKSFDTRNHPDLTKRPRLVVNFTAPAGFGACCMPDGSCRVQDAAGCASLGGSFQGAGTACGPSNPCPQPTGACCFPDTSCLLLTEADCASQGGHFNGPNVPCGSVVCPRILAKFVDPLPIPPIAQPTSGTIGGEATYTGVISQFQQQLHRDLPPTTVWGINGTYPGPTIEAASNVPVTITWINDLRDDQGNLRTSHYFNVEPCIHGPDVLGTAPRTVMHLHGANTPRESDGHPDDTILPGQQDTDVHPNTQLPATLWYHDHALGLTRLNVYMGIAGFYLLRDPFEQSLSLPSGEYEIPLIIQDKTFNNDGSLAYNAGFQDSFFGNTILVNGKVWPYLTVKRGKYRFRIVNGSNSRTYSLSLSNGTSFYQIGSDGGLLNAPVLVSNVLIAPAERADVIIDFSAFSAGTEVMLTNSAPINFPGIPGEGVIPEVMNFVVQSQTGFSGAIPQSLRVVPRTAENEARVVRTLNFQQSPHPCTGSAWLINGLLWDDIVETPRINTYEVWRFVNRSPIMHPMHMHLVQFQILDRQAFELVNNLPVGVGPRITPLATEQGWKDTVQTYPGEITRVIARFSNYPGLFPYHCHILEHEDHEMMRQMAVLPACVCDFNNDAILDTRDYFAFIASFFAGSGDINGDNVTTSQDFFDFIGCFFAGCPN
ncbi:MAG: multicopper oxidase domain-containing protein [Phycisphaerales bacterium]